MSKSYKSLPMYMGRCVAVDGGGGEVVLWRWIEILIITYNLMI